MDLKKTVSIIVPVYNAENSIGNCIKSIINQTYHYLEVLLIDDGSTDSSYDICCEYANRYPEIHVLKKLNGGVSSARNMGLDYANGEYYFFIDADDYIEAGCIQTLVSNQQDTDADIVIGGNTDVYPDGLFIKFFGVRNQCYLTKEEAIYHFLKSDYYTSVCWGRLYHKRCIGLLRFDESMQIAEDGKFFLEAIENSNSVIVIPDSLYNYVIRPGSAVHSGFSACYYSELQFLEGIVEHFEDAEELKKLAQIKLFSFIQRLIKMNDLTYQDYQILSEKSRVLLKQIKRYLSTKKKFAAVLYHNWWFRNIYLLAKTK